VAVNKALASDAVRRVFDQRGVVKPKAPNATPEFAQFVQGEADRWAKVVKQSGAKVE